MKWLIIVGLFSNQAVSQLTTRFRYGEDLNYYNRTYKTIKLAIVQDDDQILWTTWMAADLYITKGMKDLLDYRTQRGYKGDGNWTSPVVDSIYFNRAASLKICPTGWRLPRLGEWDTLVNFTTRGQKEFMFPNLSGYQSHHLKVAGDTILKEIKLLVGGYWWVAPGEAQNSVKFDLNYNYEKGVGDIWDRACVRCIKIQEDDN